MRSGRRYRFDVEPGAKRAMTDLAQTEQGAPDPLFVAQARRSWLIAAAVVVGVAVCIFALSADATLTALDVWQSSTAYNHAFLILPIALYVLYERRGIFSVIAPRPAPIFAILLLPLGAVWLVAERASIMEAQQLIMIAMLQVAIAAIVGWRAYRAMLFPCLYLFFLVPSGDFLVPVLQDFTAEFSVAAIRLFGIPVFVDGIFITIPSGSFEVAEACAGLRFLIASVAFGVLFANLVYRSNLRRAGFVAISIVVPIIANGFRAVGIIMLAYFSNNELAAGADHLVYGWVFFSFILLLLIWIGMQFRESGPSEADLVGRDMAVIAPGGSGAVLMAGVLAAVAAGAGPAYGEYLSSRPVTADLAKLTAPKVGQGWRMAPQTSEWNPKYDTADKLIRQSYRSADGKTIDLAIAYYTRQEGDKELIRYGNRLTDNKVWQRAGDGGASLMIDGQMTKVFLSRLWASGQKRLVVRIYWIGSRFTASGLKGKLFQVVGELVTGQRAAAAILLSTDYTERRSQAIQTINEFLQASEPLGPILARPG